MYEGKEVTYDEIEENGDVVEDTDPDEEETKQKERRVNHSRQNRRTLTYEPTNIKEPSSRQ